MASIAILSDIHGNLNAFEAVLADIQAHGGANRFICLGDVIGYGPKPLQCLGLARQTFELILQGNHEEAVVNGAKDFNEMAKRAIDWTRSVIVPDFNAPTPEQVDNWTYLSQLKPQAKEGMLQYVHGAPQDPVNEYIMPMDIDPQTRTYGQKLYTSFTMTDWITFCGHSHMPALYCQDGLFISPTYQKEFSYQTQPNLRYIINVGSVGQPRDGDNRACYVIWDEGKVTWRRVHYDIQDTFNSVVGISALDITLGERLFRGE